MRDTSLHRVLLGWADSGLFWWPWTRFRPAPGTRLSWGWVVVHAVSGAIWFGLPGLLVSRLLTGHWGAMEWCILPGAVGAVSGAIWGAMVRLAWDRRVVELVKVGAGQAGALPGPRRVVDRCLTETAVIFAGIALGIAVVWNVENLRGQQALRRFQAEVRAKGGPVTIQDLVPPPVPEEKNLAMAPVFRWMLDYERRPRPGFRAGTEVVWGESHASRSGRDVWNVQASSPTFEAFRTEQRRAEARKSSEKLPPLEGLGTWTDGQSVDLALWQAYYRSLSGWPLAERQQTPAKDVLLALTRLDPELEELRGAAAERPECRFPLRYEDGFAMLLPQLAQMKKIATALRLRAVALLADGRTEEALADTLLGLRMGDAMADEPTLISSLVRIAIDGLMLQPVWEGCRDHRWSEAQLVTLQKALGDRAYLREMCHALDGERLLTGVAYDLLAKADLIAWCRGREDPLAGMMGDGAEDSAESVLRWTVRLMPRGWVRQNQVVHARYLRALVEDLETARARRDLPPQGSRLEEMIHRATPFMIIAKMLAPAVDRASDKAYVMEANRRMALVGLALERHRQAAGGYPQELGALVPRFLEVLPADPMTGEPLRYARVSEHEFRLYSVGLDHQDDGGERGDRRARSASDPLRPRDLVWQ